MNIFDFFRLPRRKEADVSASRAKERLKIIVSHEQFKKEDPEFLSGLRQDLLKVLSKYVNIDAEQVNVQLQREGNHSILELNIAIPNTLCKKTTEFA